MPLVSIQDVTIQFRGPALLDGVDCLIEMGDHIGLLGRNGAGKTTLLKLLSGQLEPDHGQIERECRVSLLPQDVPDDLAGTVFDVVRSGVTADSEAGDPVPDWEIDHRVDRILSQMQLEADHPVQPMSSGMKRRVLLARALVDQPDLLLLDEPTNHLDIDAIRWLEDFLARWNGAFMFITHDRQFLRKLSTRILEIDRGKLFDWTCDYDTFLKRKQELLAAEEKQNALFDKKLAEEEAWIRQGIKARRTRNEGRVRALKSLRRERSQRREQQGTSNLTIQTGARSGNLIAQVTKVSFAHSAERQILQDFSATIMRGDKIGVIGPNGAGKTTLLKILLGRLRPQQGSVRLGTNLQVAYFDQLRDQLDGEKSVEEDVADGYQTIQINGQSRHVLGYLQDFLFTPERARTPIKRLSGGERNRVLLAKLFAQPANVIVLDEPTNDLDAETLEMLEERLVEFKGTLIVVSHDREFLNNIATSCIVFETDAQGACHVKEYVGGYDDWLRQYKALPAKASQPSQEKTTKAVDPPSRPKESSTPRKLTFKEKQELKQLPETIETLEAEVAELHQTMAEPDFYKRSGDEIAKIQTHLAELETRVTAAYRRWEELGIE